MPLAFYQLEKYNQDFFVGGQSFFPVLIMYIIVLL
jgi:hypothetical protein